MSENVTKMSDWFQSDGKVSHYCGGTTDDNKNNKPRGTQVEMTKWFCPAPLDEESGVVKCAACGGSPEEGEVLTTIEGE